MLNLPIPPADNLYKFIAISGLAFVVTAIIGLMRLSDTLERTLDRNIAAEECRTEYLMAKLHKESPPEHVKGAEVERWQKVQDEKAAKALEKYKILWAKANELDDYFTALDIGRRWSYVFWGALLVGACMMLIGFYLWYTRLQQHQDRLLLRQTKTVNNETEPIQ